MGATEDSAIRLYAMPDDAAFAVRTRWCKSVDGAFEAVEDMYFVSHSYLEHLVVVVPADLADRH